jgi:hypothetical protein
MLKSGLAAGAAAVLLSAHAVAAPTITTFDPQGSVFTWASSINTTGAVTGYYNDKGGVGHGFVRAADGTITTFDAPDVGQVKNPNLTEGTFPASINDDGTVTGYYTNSRGSHGFVRAADGAITTFSPAVSLTPVAINDRGVITGTAAKLVQRGNPAVTYGFVRLVSGIVVRFGPGDLGSDILPIGLNNTRTITGQLWDANGIHGFVRNAAGKITTFDPVGSINTFPSAINNKDTITGAYSGNDRRGHGFVRAADGTITTFDFVGATDTAPESINGAGWIAGAVEDSTFHGFVRTPAGKLTKFDAPGSTSTEALSINARGAVTGICRGQDHAYHGFVRSAP